MATVTTAEEIVNLALDLLGQEDPISDLATGTSDIEIISNRWYDTVRRKVLRMYAWNFANVLDVLSVDESETPAFGYDYAFELPDDCLRVLQIGNSVDGVILGRNLYGIYGRFVYVRSEGISSTTPTISIAYTSNVEDVELFDAMFVNLLAIELAATMAYKITLKPSVRQELKNLQIEARADAASTNGQEMPPIRIETNSLTQRRSRLLGPNSLGSRGGTYYDLP